MKPFAICDFVALRRVGEGMGMLDLAALLPPLSVLPAISSSIFLKRAALHVELMSSVCAVEKAVFVAGFVEVDCPGPLEVIPGDAGGSKRATFLFEIALEGSPLPGLVKFWTF